MIKNFKFMSSAFLIAATLAVPRSSHAMESGLPDISKDVDNFIVRRAAYDQCLDDKIPVTLQKTLNNLALVCTTWQGIIEDEMRVNGPSWKAWYGVVGHEDIYETFLNGVLLYKPDPQSDMGMIQLKLSDLINPLEGTFDLSGCGDTGKYLSISTGYRKEIKSENKDKLEIWLAPRFMIEKKLNSSARHIQPIMGDWKEETAPIGIFWIWGGWQNLSFYEYLTVKGAAQISSKDLLKQLMDSDGSKDITVQDSLVIASIVNNRRSPIPAAVVSQFMFICKPK